ncbi:MAG: hypothetical protein WKF68_12550 [Daejeonella sp.]
MKKVNEILNLRDKDIWVIGWAGYLGQATVELLLNAGAKVLCIDLEDRAMQFAQSASASDPRPLPLMCVTAMRSNSGLGTGKPRCSWKKGFKDQEP